VEWKAGPLFVGWDDDVERRVGPTCPAISGGECTLVCVTANRSERYKSLCARVCTFFFFELRVCTSDLHHAMANAPA
jgi:hypothetical protein